MHLSYPEMERCIVVVLFYLTCHHTDKQTQSKHESVTCCSSEDFDDEKRESSHFRNNPLVILHWCYTYYLQTMIEKLSNGSKNEYLTKSNSSILGMGKQQTMTASAYWDAIRKALHPAIIAIKPIPSKDIEGYNEAPLVEMR